MKESYVTNSLEDANIAEGRSVFKHKKGADYKASVDTAGIRSEYKIRVHNSDSMTTMRMRRTRMMTSMICMAVWAV